jgi:hypothetical protein
VNYNPEVSAIAAKVKYLKASVVMAHDIIVQARSCEHVNIEAQARLTRQLVETFMKEHPPLVHDEPEGKVFSMRMIPLTYEQLLTLLDEAYLRGCHRQPAIGAFR